MPSSAVPAGDEPPAEGGPSAGRRRWSRLAFSLLALVGVVGFLVAEGLQLSGQRSGAGRG